VLTAPAESTRLRIEPGRDPATWFDPGLPVLAGDATERLFPAAQPAGRHGPFALFQHGDWLIGAASAPCAGALGDHTRSLYRVLLAAAGPRHLTRIWNYVPAINALDASGEENYHTFCRGRSLAFEEWFGPGFTSRVPAASAVGTRSDRLTIVFAATTTPPRHVENPLQLPAYDYPAAYGPRAPSFARATLVPGCRHPVTFISGTAAIRGHATVAPACTARQLDCLIENLREIGRACGLGSGLSAGPDGSRHFKVYLRHAADLAATAASLGAALLQPGDIVTYLEADICRAALNVEIEATLLPPV
jgi:chorismate lyase/3-hydroxybenzoate synthase